MGPQTARSQEPALHGDTMQKRLDWAHQIRRNCWSFVMDLSLRPVQQPVHCLRPLLDSLAKSSCMRKRAGQTLLFTRAQILPSHQQIGLQLRDRAFADAPAVLRSTSGMWNVAKRGPPASCMWRRCRRRIDCPRGRHCTLTRRRPPTQGSLRRLFANGFCGCCVPHDARQSTMADPGQSPSTPVEERARR
jgi:hypothetical protein